MAGDSHYTEGTINKARLRNIAAGVRFEMEGDWVRASKLMNDLPMDLRKALFAGQIIYGKKYKEALKGNIVNSGSNLGWAPLKETYLANKLKDPKNLNGESIGMYRGHMYRGIKLYKTGSIVSIGINKTDKIHGVGKGNELTLAQYVNVFEHGSLTMNISARPLFGPTYRQLGGNKAVSLIVIGTVKAALLLKYHIKT